MAEMLSDMREGLWTIFDCNLSLTKGVNNVQKKKFSYIFRYIIYNTYLHLHIDIVYHAIKTPSIYYRIHFLDIY